MLLALLALPLRARAEESPLAASIITSAGEYWTVPEADRERPHRLQMEIVVYYYDAAWNLLYAQAGPTASYIPVKGRSLSLRPGQRVRLEGTIIPAQGLDTDRVKAVVLDDGPLPEPKPTAGRMEDLPALNGQWVLLEGYVVGQNEPDPSHVEMRVLSEGRLVALVVQISGTDPVPQLVGARVRVRGVYDVAANAEGGIQAIQMWTTDRSRVEPLGWLANDERYKLPVTPLDQLENAEPRAWARVAGEVQPAASPGVLTLRDETGQINIVTVQPDLPPAGARVEVVGRVAPAEIGRTLLEPLVRRMGPALRTDPRPESPHVPLRMRLVEQVLQLSPAEAERRHPVTLRGIVTWSNERAGRFYLQDVSGGVAVSRPPGQAVEFGASVTVTGYTVRGRWLPEVECRTLDHSGVQPMPPPRRVSLEQAQAGAEEGRWVEMQGYVRQVSTNQHWTRLDLVGVTGEFSALLPPASTLVSLQGALVRLRGVCENQPVSGRDLGEVQLWVQNPDSIQVDEPALAPAAPLPVETITALRQAGATQPAVRRARLNGVVLLHEPGRLLHLQDETGGLLVLSRESGRLDPGMRAEVTGVAGRIGGRAVLREARWRVVAAETAAPEPLEIVDPGQINVEAEARLVRLSATLRHVATEDRQARLSLQAGNEVFEARLHEATDWRPPAEGSRLELTGVYQLEYDEYRHPHSFVLALRRPDDVVLRAAPPWWTVRRIGYAIGALTAVTLLVAGWVVALRRRVREQTEQIRLQLEKEAGLQTELERSSRLESLGVLAGGIAHDFNNLLTSILGNLGLASMDKRVMEAAGDCIAEAERGARRARDITQQLLTFAKGGDPVRTTVALPDIVTEAAQFARHGSNVRFEFDLPADLPPGDVDAGQISRVVHNLVINAVQAMPEGGVVKLSLAAANLRNGEVDVLPPGPYLRLTITDTGPGIPAEVLPRIFDPYFSTKGKLGNSGLGLATVRSIVKKHNGHVDVESSAGQGTTFRLWLPAARQEAGAVTVPLSHSSAHLPARVLVMDDEDVIRRVAGRMLALAGHDAAFAADGAEAIRTFAAARQSGRPFDLVIFDLTVPGGMGGKDALQELLKLDPDLRAVASSGYSSDPVMATPRAFGFRVSLPKPYDIPDLMRAVEGARRD